MGIARSGSGMPVGSVMHYPVNSIPAGWLKANGAAVSRATYAALFALIGTSYGVGDGSTTFNLPDLRGEFLRGLDDARGVDPARAIGSAQGGAVQSHQHNESISNQTTFGINGGGSVFYVGQNTNLPGAATGGTETRPRNVAMLACIKFRR